jgi:flagellar basal-body rod protein FlgB
LENLRPTLAEDAHARSLRPDGNTVEIEKELLTMNQNSMDYEFLTEVVSRDIKQLKMAITGRSS